MNFVILFKMKGLEIGNFRSGIAKQGDGQIPEFPNDSAKVGHL